MSARDFEDRIAFSSRLRSLILARGLPMVPDRLSEDLQAGTGTRATAQTISNWINGVQLPHRTNVAALAEWLHTTDDFLLNGVPVLHFAAARGPVSDEDAQLLQQIGQLDTYGKRVVKAMLNSLVNLKATTT